MTDQANLTGSEAGADNLIRSALREEHIKLGAEIRNIGGYEVPYRYSNEIEEHQAVREAVGLFDLSLMGIIRVTGEDSPSFLAHSLISAIKPLALGKAKYSMIVQEDGGIIDDMIVYRLGTHEFMLVQNAAAAQDVYSTLRERVGGYDAKVELLNDSTALIAVQGPKAAKLMRRVLPLDMHAVLDNLAYYTCTVLDVAGVEMIVARTGYTGEDGFEIFPPIDKAADVWNAILAAGGEVAEPTDPADKGQALGLLPCGIAARDTLRLEAGMPLYGYELTRDRTPLEAGLKSIMGPTKGQFIGRNALLNRPQPKQLLVGLRISGDEALTRGQKLVNDEGEEVGVITSSKVSPTLKYPIAFAYVDSWLASTGSELKVEGSAETATVVPTPFYNRKRRRIQ